MAGAYRRMSPNSAIPSASSSLIGPTATLVTRTVTVPASSVSAYSVSRIVPGDRRPRVAQASGGSNAVTWP